ncbi:MAG: ABC transporter ATP-binding protein [Gammaproteobacteria bacterium]|nr:ABC transporter [Gammaproteobacteria bacterium]
MTTLALDDIGVRYGARTALEPVSLDLRAGELVGLIGPNGAGKSSLLKAIAGLVPHRGTATWQSRPLVKMKRLERARTLAYLPQTPAAHWPIRVAELVALGRMPHLAFGQRPGDDDAAAVRWALEQCEALDLADRRVDRLSGGERARALLARALAVRAPILLADEPIQSLDPYHQLKIMGVLKSYASLGALVVAVLHDLALAARFCTRLVLLSHGRVVAEGRPEEVLTRSALEDGYRVEPFFSRHEGELVVLPWRQAGDASKRG